MQNKKFLSVFVSLICLFACILGVLVMSANAETEYVTWTVSGTADAAANKYATVADALVAAKAKTDWSANQGLQINITTQTAQKADVGSNTNSYDILFGVQTIFRQDNTKLPIIINGATSGVVLTHGTDQMVATNDYTFRNLKFDMGSNDKYWFFAGSGEVVFDGVDVANVTNALGRFYGDCPTADAFNGWTQAHFDANKDTEDGLLSTSVELKGITYTPKNEYRLQAVGADGNPAYGTTGANGTDGTFDGQGYTYTNGSFTIKPNNTKASLILTDATVSKVGIHYGWNHTSPVAKRILTLDGSTVDSLYGLGNTDRAYSAAPNRGFQTGDYIVNVKDTVINTRFELIRGAVVRGDVTLNISGNTVINADHTTGNALVMSADMEDNDIIVNISGGLFPKSLNMIRNTGVSTSRGKTYLNITGGTFGYNAQGQATTGVLRGFNLSGFGVCENDENPSSYINASTGKAENLPYADVTNITGGNIREFWGSWYRDYYSINNIGGTAQVGTFAGTTLQASAGGLFAYVENNVTGGTVGTFTGGGAAKSCTVTYLVNTVSGGNILNFGGAGFEKTYTTVINRVTDGTVGTYYGAHPLYSTALDYKSTVTNVTNHFEGGSITTQVSGAGHSKNQNQAAVVNVTNNLKGTLFGTSAAKINFYGTSKDTNSTAGVVTNVTNNVSPEGGLFYDFIGTGRLSGNVVNNIGDPNATERTAMGHWFYGSNYWVNNCTNNIYNVSLGQTWLAGNNVGTNVVNNLKNVGFGSYVYATAGYVKGTVTNNFDTVSFSKARAVKLTSGNYTTGLITNNLTNIQAPEDAMVYGSFHQANGGIVNNIVGGSFGGGFYGSAEGKTTGNVTNTVSGDPVFGGHYYGTYAEVTGNVTNYIHSATFNGLLYGTGGAVGGTITNYLGAMPDGNGGLLIQQEDGKVLGGVDYNVYLATSGAKDIVNHWYKMEVRRNAYGNDGTATSVTNHFYAGFKPIKQVNGAGGSTGGDVAASGGSFEVVNNFYDGADIAIFAGIDGKNDEFVSVSKIVNNVMGGHIGTFYGGGHRGTALEIVNNVTGGEIDNFYGGNNQGLTARTDGARYPINITNSITGGFVGTLWGGNSSLDRGYTLETITTTINGGGIRNQIFSGNNSAFEPASATTTISGTVYVASETFLAPDVIEAVQIVQVEDWLPGHIYLTTTHDKASLISIGHIDPNNVTNAFMDTDDVYECHLTGFSVPGGMVLASLDLKERVVLKAWFPKEVVDVYIQKLGKPFEYNVTIALDSGEKLLGKGQIDAVRRADASATANGQLLEYYVVTLSGIGAGDFDKNIHFTGTSFDFSTTLLRLASSGVSVYKGTEYVNIYKAIYDYGAAACGIGTKYAELVPVTEGLAQPTATRGATDSIRFTSVAPLMGDAVGIRLIGTPAAGYDVNSAVLTLGGEILTLNQHYTVKTAGNEVYFDLYFGADYMCVDMEIEVYTQGQMAMRLNTSVERAAAQLYRENPDSENAIALLVYIQTVKNYIY